MDNQPTSDLDSKTTTSHLYPQSKFIVLLLLLIAILIFRIATPFLIQDNGTQQPSHEATLQADIVIKSYYAFQDLLKSEEDDWFALYKKGSLRTAEDIYWKEVEANPTIYTIRRLVIIAHPKDKNNAIDQYPKIKTDHLTRPQIREEADIWRAIYKSREAINKSTARTYALRIHDMKLGWYEHLALQDLYNRADMPGKAEEEKKAAIESATRTIIFYFMLTVFFLLAFITGIGLLIAYIVRQSRGWPAPPNPAVTAPQPDRSHIAGYMLEVFLVYMLVLLASEILSSGFLIITDQSDSSLITVSLTVSLHIFAGLLSLLYLWHRLTLAGWNWLSIDLQSRNACKEVVWGISGYISALPLLALAGLISQLLDKLIKTPLNPVIPLLLETGGWLERLALLLLVAVAAPFFEEIFFRGVLLNCLSAKWGLKIGVVLSATIFAFLHPLPISFLPIFVLGILFAILRIHTRSLVPCMIAHCINNTITYTVIYMITLH